jgi:hypothetical protein
MSLITSRGERGLPAVAALLAKLLQRLDASRVSVDAAQYRAVAERLAEEFDALQGDAALAGLLDAFPAAAELYENRVYSHAGLCRSPLEAAMSAELQARLAIDRARRA